MILDASAILAVLYAEPGRDVVAAGMQAGAAACSVNLAEVATVLVRKGTVWAAAAATVAELPITVCDADLDLAMLAASFYAETKPFGLSLGDRFCLALALRESRPAMTTDRIWQKVGPTLGVDIRIIR